MSRTLTAAGAVAACAAVLAAAAPSGAEECARLVSRALASAGAAGSAPGAASIEALLALARLALAPALAAAAGALVAGMAQTGGLFAAGALRARWERLDPAGGLRRLLSPGAAGGTLLQAVLALAAVALCAAELRDLAPALAQVPRHGHGPAASLLAAAIGRMAAWMLPLAAGAGAVDLALARWRHGRALRMTWHEVVRDLREDEGDPRLKSERRRRHGDLLARERLPRATCLVVNPTHLAVILGHHRGSDEAPVVLAKRRGAAAVSLRRQARRAGLPVVPDAALARALWRLAEVGESIPEELYDAAAAVLARVHGTSLEVP